MLRFLGAVLSLCKSEEIFFKSKNVWEFKALAIPMEERELYRLRIPKRALQRRGLWAAR